MDIQTLLSIATDALTRAGIDNPSLDSRVLLKHTLQCDDAYLIAHGKDTPLPNDTCVRFSQLIRLRTEHMPVAYILNQKEFMSLSFYVDENVLIPRPDSEVLVEEALRLLSSFPKTSPPPRLLDLCCGSGCLGLSVLANMPAAQADFADISPQALDVCRHNAQRLCVQERSRFFIGSLFDALPPQNSYDLILCNPPYVKREEYDALPPDIQNYEPPLALLAGDDGLLFYRTIAKTLRPFLKDRCPLIIEINSAQAAQTRELFVCEGFTTRTLRDLSGLDRALVVV